MSPELFKSWISSLADGPVSGLYGTPTSLNDRTPPRTPSPTTNQYSATPSVSLQASPGNVYTRNGRVVEPFVDTVCAPVPTKNSVISVRSDALRIDYLCSTLPNTNAISNISVRTRINFAIDLPVVPSIFRPAIEALQQRRNNANSLYEYLPQTPYTGWPWCMFRRIITGHVGCSVRSRDNRRKDVCVIVKIGHEENADTLLRKLEEETGSDQWKSSTLFQDYGYYSCIVSNRDGSMFLCLAVGFFAYWYAVFAETLTNDVY